MHLTNKHHKVFLPQHKPFNIHPQKQKKMKEQIQKKFNIKISGKGNRVMLFAHGFGCDQNMWRYVTPAFEEEYKIVVFDYIGHGKSDLSAYNPEKYSSLSGYADDILAIAEGLELKDIIFVGHSVSSVIGLIAAVKKPELFSHMIMVGPSPRYLNDTNYVGGFEKKDILDLLDTMEKNYIGWANFLAPAVMKNPESPALAEELKESFCSTDPVVARQFAEVTFLSDNRNDLSKLKVPSLILQCSDDLIAPTEVGKYMHDKIAGSTLHHLKATGHCPHMSAPEETIEAIQNYLLKEKVAETNSVLQ
jgi:sigma-B regulation protein RsbQ